MYNNTDLMIYLDMVLCDTSQSYCQLLGRLNHQTVAPDLNSFWFCTGYQYHRCVYIHPSFPNQPKLHLLDKIYNRVFKKSVYCKMG